MPPTAMMPRPSAAVLVLPAVLAEVEGLITLLALLTDVHCSLPGFLLAQGTQDYLVGGAVRLAQLLI